VLGGELDRRVLSIAAVTLVYSASFSTFWVYVGVYAVKGLGWPAARVGLLFLLSAPAAAVANYFSGRISDHTGRKSLIVGSFLASAANVAALSMLGHRTPVAFALIVAQGVIGAPAYSLDRALVADLVPEPEGREGAYSTVRVAANVGAFVGPPLAALLIFVGGWTTFLMQRARARRRLARGGASAGDRRSVARRARRRRRAQPRPPRPPVRPAARVDATGVYGLLRVRDRSACDRGHRVRPGAVDVGLARCDQSVARRLRRSRAEPRSSWA